MDPEYPHDGPFAFVTGEAVPTSALVNDIRRIRELLADLERKHAEVSDDSEVTINNLVDLRRTVHRHSAIIHQLLDGAPRNEESHRLLRLLDQGDDASYITTDEIQQQINDLLYEVSARERDVVRLNARVAALERDFEKKKIEDEEKNGELFYLYTVSQEHEENARRSHEQFVEASDKVERMQRDAERTRRDVERMQRDAERTRRDTIRDIREEVARQLAEAKEQREVDVELRQIASNMFDVVKQKLFSEGVYTSRSFQQIGIHGTPRDKTRLNEELARVARGLGFHHHEWTALSAFRRKLNAEHHSTLDNVDIERIKNRLLSHSTTLRDAFHKTLSLLNL